MKLKSHSGMKKRVKRTGSGKLRMQKGHKNHLLHKKSKRQKKLEHNGKEISPSNLRSVEQMVPYL